MADVFINDLVDLSKQVNRQVAIVESDDYGVDQARFALGVSRAVRLLWTGEVRNPA